MRPCACSSNSCSCVRSGHLPVRKLMSSLGKPSKAVPKETLIPETSTFGTILYIAQIRLSADAAFAPRGIPRGKGGNGGGPCHQQRTTGWRKTELCKNGSGVSRVIMARPIEGAVNRKNKCT